MPSRKGHLPRACLRCRVVKPAESFDWGDGTRGAGLARRRRGLCRDCVDTEAKGYLRAARSQGTRRATWEQDGIVVRRCSRCREVLPLEASFYFAGKKGLERWRYMCKVCDGKRIEALRLKRKGDPEFLAKQAAWKHAWAKRNPERYHQIQRESARRIRKDPKRHAVYLENARIAYRLRKEREGGRLEDIRQQRTKTPFPRDVIDRLPAYPLAVALEAMIARDAGCEEDPRGRICQAAGIAPRNLLAWYTGERVEVQFNVADRVLVGLGLAWWDVWTGDTAEVARLAFEGEEVVA